MSEAPVVELDAGSFLMGSDDFYPEEGPMHEVEVAPFAIDRYAVTNREFAQFVEETCYVTVAERAPDPEQFPGADPAVLVPGSLVFTPTAGPVDLRDWRQWWSWRPGASWRHPFGPGSNIEGKMEHPVVQVSFEDATTYAGWAGKRLPTEKEWEYAARGGIRSAVYAWGDEPNEPPGLKANTWQGHFPYRNHGANGWVGTAPVGSFAPNGYGLFDMTGNTWEWTVDGWSDRHPAAPVSSCGCGPGGDTGPAIAPGTRVLKGGSHLCAPEYCLRYRPAARSPQTEDSATTHIGFRCVL
ncbi:formylglycine-generating enzyme required for sulfatase activity [Arthrobacter pigmenti]|uniref:Formylglycine-generating enzyme required for sulfatase activity n=1 Tax=Arthrobacter pigmenti TaxID=271432 RepID=A0A846RNY8_9MICC|nr:formylglycine-generating enzyme family protein [Arthrobacter pigmenti]NJC21495.1 formylglycine-generating enzyme required for sulfatase activity [Arthrobacter pigmenti]